MTPPLLLASGSPRRREILERLGLAFEVAPPPADVESPWGGSESPAAFAERMAREKGRAVSVGRRDAIVVAADTVVDLDGEVLEKPRDAADARRMLASLAGRHHLVHTGVATALGNRSACGIETTRVRFRSLDEDAIAAYVATGEPLDKAGAYGIQGYGAALVESVHGCYFNVMGLPVNRFLGLLEAVGWRYAFPGRLVASVARA